jgi:hypothetical protein
LVGWLIRSFIIHHHHHHHFFYQVGLSTQVVSKTSSTKPKERKIKGKKRLGSDKGDIATDK